MAKRTITNPAAGSAPSSSVMRNELQLLENEIADTSAGHHHDGVDSRAITPVTTVGVDGWVSTSDVWTYASATVIGGSGGQNTNYYSTVTITGDKTTTYYPGMKFKATNSDSTLMGFIMAVSYSSPSTTLTLWSGQTYAFAAGAITNTYYSTAKAPAEFDMNTYSWRILVVDTSDRINTTPTAGTWYAPTNGVISLPVGAWKIGFKVLGQIGKNTNGTAKDVDLYFSLNSGNVLTITALWAGFREQFIGSNNYATGQVWARTLQAEAELLYLSSPVNYTLDYYTTATTQVNIGTKGGTIPTEIWANTSYL